MKTKIQSICKNRGSVLDKKLIIERKQNIFPLQKIPHRDQNTPINTSPLSKEKSLPNQKNFTKTFSIKIRRFPIIPYLINNNNRDPPLIQQSDKNRSKTETSEIRKKLQLFKNPQNSRQISSGQLNRQQKPSKIAKQKSQINYVPKIFAQFNYQLMVQKQIIQHQNNNKSIENGLLSAEKGSSFKKSFQSIGVATDFEIHNESYKEFLKFKITQSQKYEKMKSIFDYIDKISSDDLEKFDQRSQQIKNRYKLAMQQGRQKGIEEMCQSFIEKEKNIEKCFFRVLKDLTILQQENNKSVNKQIQIINQQIKKIKDIIISERKPQSNTQFQIKEKSLSIKSKKVKQNNESKTDTFEKIQDLLHQTSKQLEIFEKLSMLIEKNSRQRHEDKQLALQEAYKQVNNCLEQSKYNTIEKQCAIQVCVQDILRLPEMSCAIFGMGRDHLNSEQSQMMKNIGVHLDDVTDFGMFYKKSHNEKQVSQAFRQMASIKCLNCAYLKSKMKFIYSKNQQLGPVMKILKYLIKWERKRIL